MTTSEQSKNLVSVASESVDSLDWDVELDKYVVRLEQAYTQRSKASPPIDVRQFVPPHEHPRYHDIVRELIRVDMELSAVGGVVRGVDFYRPNFGQLLNHDSICVELDFEQRRLRQESPKNLTDSPSSDEDFPKLNQQLCGFQLQSELGRGSFGRVYLALESGLANRRVVLKVSSQFPGEAELLSKLQHKNIVPIYSMHRHNQWHVVCMPMLGTTTLSDLLKAFAHQGHMPSTGKALIDTIKFCASETLSREQLKDETTVPPKVEAKTTFEPINDILLNRLRERFKDYSYGQAVIWMVAQLADGLVHAHDRRIFHRDIKPANVLLSDDGLPMLLDFNLATENHVENGESRLFGGTPRYMAPEQLQEVLSNSCHTDARSDLFSLGVILFELLTMRPPFPDRNGVGREVLQKMLEDRRVSPELHPEKPIGITTGILAILRKSLQFDPANRYQSAEDFLTDLNCELGYQPLPHATGESLQDRLRKWNKRHPRLSASTLVVSAAAVVLMLTSIGLYSQNRRVNQLKAVNWLADAKTSRGIAQGLFSSIELPTEQLRSMIASCDQVLLQKQSIDLSFLSQDQAFQGKELMAQLLQVRARGNARLATRQSDAALTTKLLESAAEDAQQASQLSATQAGNCQALLIAIHRELQKYSTHKDDPSQITTSLVLSREQIQDSITDMKMSLTTDAANPWLWTNLAQLQLEACDKNSAQASLRIALDLDAKLPWPSLMLSTLELDRSRFREAKDLLNQTLELDNRAVDAYLNRAIANIGLGDLEAALQDLNEIEEHALVNPRILFVREIVNRRLGKQAEADKDRDNAMALEPRDARSWNARGEARLRINPPNPKGALADFKQASLVSPSLRNSYENMALVLSEYLNQPAEAIGALDDAITCDPDYALAWSSRSVLQARAGNVEHAVADAQRALELERTPIVCYQAASAFALIRRDAKDEQFALSLLRETARQNPALAELMQNDKDLVRIENQKSLKQIIAAARQLQ